MTIRIRPRERFRSCITLGNIYVPHDQSSSTALMPFCRQIEHSAELLQALLGGFPGHIEVRILDKPLKSKALHALGIVIISRLKLPDRTAIVHELAHVVAGPSVDPTSLLDEGLAVYLQEQLGGPSDLSFPTHGQELHGAAREAIQALGSLPPFSQLVPARNWKYLGDQRRLFYLLAGSFTKFAVEHSSLNRFLDVYAGRASWVERFGAPMSVLEQAWREWLQAERISRPDDPSSKNGNAKVWLRSG
jgi:hypothetical protein